MKVRLFLFGAGGVLAAAVVGAACGGGADSATTTPAPTVRGSTTAAPASPTEAAPTAGATTAATTGPTAPPVGTPIVLPNPKVTASGLKYVDIAVGKGASPRPDQTVIVRYTGRLAANAQVFDTSGTRQVTFPMNGVIPGFAEALSTMNAGGRRTAYIPAALAYGAAGYGPVPANADLVFDIELIGIK
ncbi:MAG: FKBP-type peptidyl-prolyl cis-trans isomerase [Chloroflexi bacterium]|nr:FKBP-type peptidyl-prolyl cis-trans isomerase [Chloroflexota bacterium]